VTVANAYRPEPGSSFVDMAEARARRRADFNGRRHLVDADTWRIEAGMAGYLLTHWAPLLDELTAIVGALSADQISDARCRAGLPDISDRLVK
jgi:hypothetical protein